MPSSGIKAQTFKYLKKIKRKNTIIIIINKYNKIKTNNKKGLKLRGKKKILKRNSLKVKGKKESFENK